MADSRRASFNKLADAQYIVETQSRVIQFLSSILISLLLTYLLRDESMVPPQIYVLFLLFLSIGLWVTEAIPPFAVGIMIVGFLVFSLGQPSLEQYDIDVVKFVNTWSDSVIWLLLGGFFLAKGMERTGLDLSLFKVISRRFKDNPTILLLALMITTACFSMVMSNTATAAMMFASLMPLINRLGHQNGYSKCLLLGIPSAASIGGMGTIIGSPPNAIAVDMINKLLLVDQSVDFFDWMILGFPVAIVLTILFWFLLLKKYKFDDHIDLADLSDPTVEKKPRLQYIVSWDSQRIVLFVLSTTMLLWLTDSLHAIPMAAVSGIPIVALTMTNIIRAEDVRSLPWDTLMLVAGGLSLGLAIQETGLMDYFLNQLEDLTLPMWLLLGVFAVITVISSNIMSNTAAAAILIPSAILWNTSNPIVLPLIIGLCASCALFLPVSTPPNAIAYSTGMLNQREFRYGGVIIGILGPVLISIWVLLMY